MASPLNDATDRFRVGRLFALAVLYGALSVIIPVLVGMAGGMIVGLLVLLIVGPLAAYSLGQKTREEILGLLLGAVVGLVGGYGSFFVLSMTGAQVTGHIAWLPHDGMGWFGFIVVPVLVCAYAGKQGTDLADVY